MDSPVVLDGSLGEGGGQILRTALALSLATGRPFRIENIRAGRRKPGLLRQHLTGVKLAAAIGCAELEGATLGSTALTFRPQACQAGAHHVKVGTAGSTSLVCQAVAPALLFADGPSRLTIEGGTHATSAPPFEFLDAAWGRALRDHGATLRMDLERPGFFPAGGGRVSVAVEPWHAPRPVHLVERGARVSVEAVALVSKIAGAVGERELKVVEQRLGWPKDALHVRTCRDAIGPGNVLILRLAYEHVTEVIVSFGALGRPAEAVARAACSAVRQWLRHEAPVGPHLADQLMLPLVLGAGGVYRTQGLTPHSRTNIDTIQRFLPGTIQVHPAPQGGVDVRIAGVRGSP